MPLVLGLFTLERFPPTRLIFSSPLFLHLPSTTLNSTPRSNTAKISSLSFTPWPTPFCSRAVTWSLFPRLLIAVCQINSFVPCFSRASVPTRHFRNGQ